MLEHTHATHAHPFTLGGMFAQMQGGYNGPSKSDADAVARPFEVRCHLGAMLAGAMAVACARVRLYSPQIAV